DRNPGGLRKAGEDVLVERVLKVAAVDADLYGAILRAQDRRHGEHSSAGEASGQHASATHGCPCQLLHLSFLPAVRPGPLFSIPGRVPRRSLGRTLYSD